MKKIVKMLSLLIVLGFAMQSCDKQDDENKPIKKESYSSIKELFENLAYRNVEKQTFEFTNDKGAKIVGKGGVQIDIQPNACDNLPADAKLKVHLSEFLTLDKMFYGSVYTESNGQLLVTGGSFEFRITDDKGKDVDYNIDMVQSIIPVKTNIKGYRQNMTLFLGERKGVEGDGSIVNWMLPAPMPLPNPGEGEVPIIGDGVIVDENGNELFEIPLTLKGFSNCDALLEIPADKRTQFKVNIEVPNTVEISKKYVAMFVKDFPSVINIYTIDGQFLSTYKESIPMGLNATLVAIALDKKGNLLVGSKDINVKGDDIFEINTEYSTSEDLQKLINKISK